MHVINHMREALHLQNICAVGDGKRKKKKGRVLFRRYCAIALAKINKREEDRVISPRSDFCPVAPSVFWEGFIGLTLSLILPSVAIQPGLAYMYYCVFRACPM